MFKQAIANLAEILIRQGVRRVVIAPGSRNAPLTMALTSRKELDCISVTDERSAAFMANGIAQFTQEPVAVVCTSGTAVLNFAPAVAEAYYQNLPLIVITADRPVAWIDQSDGQTIRQQNIFQPYIKSSYQFPEGDEKNDTWFADRMVSEALDTAKALPAGPVHVNIPLNEPLYVALPEASTDLKIMQTEEVNIQLSDKTASELNEIWKSAARKMIVVGIHHPDAEFNKLLNDISENEDVVVIAENLSNVAGDKIISAPDVFFASLSDEDKKALRPDLLITIGNSVISKQLKMFLKAFPPADHWQVGAPLPYADTYKSLRRILPVTAEALLKKMQKVNFESNYSAKSQNLLLNSKNRIQKFVDSTPFCDIRIIFQILDSVPSDYVLQLSNSTPVRIAQLKDTRNDISYFCNRGTSGIEGSLSTAAGSAYASGKKTLFLTGDLSFIYDSNGLWNNYVSADLKIIVMNNGGANIFRIIGNSELTADCQQFFDAPHQVDLAALSHAFGLQYIKCENDITLTDALQQLWDAKQTTVLEICTPMEVNVQTYKELFKTIK